MKRFPDGRTITQITGIMQSARDTRVTVQCPRRAFPLYFTFAAAGTHWPGEIKSGESTAHASLKAGRVLFSFVSAEPLETVTVTSNGGGTIPWVMEAADFSPPENAVRFEAEDTGDPYRPQPRAIFREGASGGRILPQTLDLAAGKHVLSICEIENSGNLDCFALMPDRP